MMYAAFPKWYILFFAITLTFLSCNREDDIDIPTTGEVSLDILLETPNVVTLNPNGKVPLAAVVKVQSKTPTTVTMNVPQSGLETQTYDDPATSHDIIVLGLAAADTNQIILRIEDALGAYAYDTLLVRTEAIPTFLPTIEIATADLPRMEPGMNLSGLNIGREGPFKTVPIIFDHEGNIRWYMDLEFTGGWTGPIKRLQNGNLAFARFNTIYEYDMAGREIRRWDCPDYAQHHDLFEKPNGNFLFPASTGGTDTYLDQFAEIDRNSGQLLRTWDLREVLDIDRYDLNFSPADWIHVNSVWFVEADESLLFSGRSQGIINISKENQLNWILAPHKGWGQAGITGDGVETADYLLTAIDANGVPFPEDIQLGTASTPEFEWPWGQHAVMPLENGNILAFDNGWRRNFRPNGNDSWSRLVEYKIDLENRTVQQVWEFGKERGMSSFSNGISDADFLPQTQNRLFCPGNVYSAEFKRAQIIEITPQNEVVFEANINFTNETAISPNWTDSDLIYRSERLTLYPENK